jgi:hypothetical protein
MGQNAKFRGDRRMSALAPKADISRFMSTRPRPTAAGCIGWRQARRWDAAACLRRSDYFRFWLAAAMACQLVELCGGFGAAASCTTPLGEPDPPWTGLGCGCVPRFKTPWMWCVPPCLFAMVSSPFFMRRDRPNILRGPDNIFRPRFPVQLRREIDGSPRRSR